MFNWIIKKIHRQRKTSAPSDKLQPLSSPRVNRIEAHLQNESDEALRDRVAAWKDQFRAFHTPKFLGGVSLRVATEEEVDACLRNVNEAFLRLKPHFPSLANDYLADNSWASASMDDKKARIDRAREAGTRSSLTSMPSSKRCSTRSCQKCTRW
jgi:preprotein translocase subunit SecA